MKITRLYLGMIPVIGLVFFYISACGRQSTKQRAPVLALRKLAYLGNSPLFERRNLREYRPGEVVIKFKSTCHHQSINEILAKLSKRVRILGVRKLPFHPQPLERYPRQMRASVQRKTPILEKVYLLNTDPQNTGRLMEHCREHDEIEFVEPNYRMKAFSSVAFLPNDFYLDSNQDQKPDVGAWGQIYPNLWGLLKTEAVHSTVKKAGAGVVVAVIDSGVDYHHEDIVGNIWKNAAEMGLDKAGKDKATNEMDDDGNGYIDDHGGYDFVDNDNDPMDDVGHGTHVAGTIAAVGNNHIGIMGVAPRSKIMAIRGLGRYGGDTFGLSAAIIYAADNGADVINNSWGGQGESKLLEEAVNYAFSQGSIVVAAAGNSNSDATYFRPAGLPNVISVASANYLDQRSSFSNWGKIDVAAPGGSGSEVSVENSPALRDILSLRAFGTDMYEDGFSIVGEKYYRSRGTSMAAPHVAGVVALILGENPEHTNEEVRMIIRSSADDMGAPGFDRESGYGRVNANKALTIVKPQVARIYSPRYGEWIGQSRLEISGIASAPYRLAYQEENASTWVEFGVGNSVSNGTLGELDLSKLRTNRNKSIYLRVQIRADGSIFEDNVRIRLPDRMVKEGYPNTIADAPASSPLFADLNGDKKKEMIIVTMYGTVHIFNGQGKELTGFPVALPNYPIISSPPSVGDIDGDGKREIVILSTASFFEGDGATHGTLIGALYVLDTTGHVKPGFPLSVGLPFENTFGGSAVMLGPAPVLVDLDSDAILDIVAAGSSSNGFGKPTFIEAVSGTGRKLWQRLIQTEDYDLTLAGSPAVGDIDGDKRPDIVASYVQRTEPKSFEEPNLSSQEATQVVALSHEGQMKKYWPRQILARAANGITFGLVSPILADLSGDNSQEVIVPVPWAETESRTPLLHVFDGNARISHSWFQTASTHAWVTSVIAGNIDGNGKNEVVVSYQKWNPNKKRVELLVSAIDGNGQNLPSWPKRIGKYALAAFDLKSFYQALWQESPQITMGNIQGGQAQEILVTKNGLGNEGGNWNGLLYYSVLGFDHRGGLISGRPTFPVISHEGEFVFSPFTLDDMDGDGRLEGALITESGRIFIWDLKSRYVHRQLHWPMLYRNRFRTSAQP